MDYYIFAVGNKEYKLRLNTRSCVELERKMGKNPVQLLMEMANNKLPLLYELALILHASLQALHHGISIDETYEIIDAFMAAGNGMFDLVPVFVEVFRNAGFIAKESEEPKNE